MQEPLIPDDEPRRLAALRVLGLLDTPPEERFDRITRMAQRLFEVPVALVTLVDEDRQWFKSNQGLQAAETPRSISFCGHVVASGRTLVVEDALVDPRFADNPLVTDDPAIRFYAGAPIAAPDGSLLGTLCVIDRAPRELSAADQRTLEDLATMVEHEIAFTHLAVTDELTGLHNRRGFQLVGEQVLALCRREHLPAVLLFADLDGLKAINDELGHEAGDQAIRAVAEVLTTSFRQADVVARIGGDELCALLAGSGAGGDPIDRFTGALARRSTELGLNLRASVGSARWDPERPVGLDDLLAQADAAMYEEKQRRRNEGPNPTG